MDSPSWSSPSWVILARSSPSWGLLHHYRKHLTRRSERGQITIAATAFTAITIIAVAIISSAIDHRHRHHRHRGTHTLPRVVPSIAELSVSLHSIMTLSGMVSLARHSPCGTLRHDHLHRGTFRHGLQRGKLEHGLLHRGTLRHGLSVVNTSIMNSPAAYSQS